ncbi:MAG TPA: hypothetical protein VEU31_08290 [Candidatus Acidoferrales bacterium]|nr:hypothetical protein [Candidatus Acidoferrales bacterium]
MKQKTLSLRPTKAGQARMAVNPVSPLSRYFDALFFALGPRKWWPAKTQFEVIVGAILTQNTAWVNVEQAMENLRKEKMLSVRSMERAELGRLARLVRPSGYFRQKAKKLKAFTKFLRVQFAGSLSKMFRTPTTRLREQLLAVHGIGPETADSILLYAGGHTVFVVDAYTRRILERHALAQADLPYEEMQSLLETSLPRDAQLYNEFHALIVEAGKRWCRRENPRCDQCPLRPFLPEEKVVPSPEVRAGVMEAQV